MAIKLKKDASFGRPSIFGGSYDNQSMLIMFAKFSTKKKFLKILQEKHVV